MARTNNRLHTPKSQPYTSIFTHNLGMLRPTIFGPHSWTITILDTHQTCAGMESID